MDPSPNNVFRQLAAWFSSGQEDFFTACLALFLKRDEAFRSGFLEWISPYVAEDLGGRAWQVSAQVSRPSRKGEAVLDMVLASDDLEFWFEHKTGAGLGQYEELDQLEKYLDAANRVMLGVSDGITPVEWPRSGPKAGCPRVVLFYITRKPKALDRSRYEDRIYGPTIPYGLTWPQNGHLRWRDLWTIANHVLRVLEGAVFESELAVQFLDYWQSIPGMWKLDAVDGWVDLLPHWRTLPPAQPCPFDEIWDALVAYAREDLGCERVVPWRGYEQRLVVPPQRSDEVDSISVAPAPDISNLENWRGTLGNYVLRLLIRRRDGSSWAPVSFERMQDDHAVRGRVVSGGKHLEVLVGIAFWPQEADLLVRQRATLRSFRAAMNALQREVGDGFASLASP